MALASQERLQRGQKKGYSAAKVRLAGLADAANIAQLMRFGSKPPTLEEVANSLEQGGALLLEDKSGNLLCVLMWLETGEGWTLQQPAVLEAYRDQELDRWVLTKLEALAIQRNIPVLNMQLEDETLLPYYKRMGYRLEAQDNLLLSKRVGGTWQTKRG